MRNYKDQDALYRNLDGRMEKERKGGEEKGRREGRLEERKAIAKSLLAQNAPLSMICTATGLSEEEITSL